jgi:ABC-type multidrug transport system fused ATPase/permease subunit
MRRHVMAVVAQEPTLFAGSIKENIAYGREGASQAQWAITEAYGAGCPKG